MDIHGGRGGIGSGGVHPVCFPDVVENAVNILMDDMGEVILLFYLG